MLRFRVFYAIKQTVDVYDFSLIMLKKIKDQLKSAGESLCSGGALKYLVVLGIILRLKHFLGNRSLWLDEAHVAMNISNRTLERVFYNLSTIQDLAVPPVGFSVFVKSLTLLLGNNASILLNNKSAARKK